MASSVSIFIAPIFYEYKVICCKDLDGKIFKLDIGTGPSSYAPTCSKIT